METAKAELTLANEELDAETVAWKKYSAKFHANYVVYQCR